MQLSDLCVQAHVWFRRDSLSAEYVHSALMPGRRTARVCASSERCRRTLPSDVNAAFRSLRQEHTQVLVTAVHVCERVRPRETMKHERGCLQLQGQKKHSPSLRTRCMLHVRVRRIWITFEPCREAHLQAVLLLRWRHLDGRGDPAPKGRRGRAVHLGRLHSTGHLRQPCGVQIRHVCQAGALPCMAPQLLETLPHESPTGHMHSEV